MEAVHFKQDQVSWRASWHLSWLFLKAVLCKLELVQHLYVHEEHSLPGTASLSRSLLSISAALKSHQLAAELRSSLPVLLQASAGTDSRSLLITLCWETTGESEAERLPNEPRNLRNIPSTGETWKKKVTKDQRRLISISYYQALTKNVSACLSYCVLKIK